MKNRTYYKEMIVIGLPITIQSIFQASYSLVDQIMVGSLGTISIAASGLGAKFSSLVTVTLTAVATVASILIAQYYGSEDKEGINKSFFSCLYIAIVVMISFTVPAVIVPYKIMNLYTTDSETILEAGKYLRIIAVSFLPMSLTLVFSSLLRSIELSKYPMYASIMSMSANIVFNYMFIFGKMGMPKLGLMGAGIGTLLARILEALVLFIVIIKMRKQSKLCLSVIRCRDSTFYRKIKQMMIPILVNEFSWSVGENIYAAIYGRLGTRALAAVTLTGPLQAMFIGMFSGLSSAAVVMIGKRLGRDEDDEAYHISKLLIKVGIIASIVISILLTCIAGFYVQFFNIEPEVATLTRYLIYALSIVLFAKVSNMIVAGGVIRSGGNTKITLWIDLIGTWIFGVPLGLFSAYVLKLPVYAVYFILSQEEVVRLIIGIYVFRKRKWMQKIAKTQETGLKQ